MEACYGKESHLSELYGLGFMELRKENKITLKVLVLFFVYICIFYWLSNLLYTFKVSPFYNINVSFFFPSN